MKKLPSSPAPAVVSALPLPGSWGLDGYNIVMVATGAQEKNQPALDTLQALGIDCAYVQANIGCTDDRKKFWTPRWLPLGGWMCWSTTPASHPRSAPTF